MQALFNELSNEIQNEYLKLYDMENKINGGADAPAPLFLKYDVINTILRKTEYELNNEELTLELSRISIKSKAMEQGLKSTEAREVSKKETEALQKEIFKRERDVNLLKDVRKSLELQIKYTLIWEALKE